MKAIKAYEEPVIEIVAVQAYDILTESDDMFGGVDFGGNLGWEE